MESSINRGDEIFDICCGGEYYGNLLDIREFQRNTVIELKKSKKI